jgi:ATP-dependent Clp protease ATP-binding subunit ClpC
LREALALGHNYIGTEHVLLGLIREPGGVAWRILTEHDLNMEMIHTAVIRALSGGVRSASSESSTASIEALQAAIDALIICRDLARYRNSALEGKRTLENLAAQVIAIVGLDKLTYADLQLLLRMRDDLKKDTTA